MKKLFLTTVLALGLPAVAYGQSDMTLLQKAQNGDVDAQADVAINYQFGKMGFPKDQEKAIKWNKISADKGNKLSQFRLGMIYKYDQTPPNYSQAKYYFNLACKQNLDDACGEYDTIE